MKKILNTIENWMYDLAISLDEKVQNHALYSSLAHPEREGLTAEEDEIWLENYRKTHNCYWGFPISTYLEIWDKAKKDVKEVYKVDYSTPKGMERGIRYSYALVIKACLRRAFNTFALVI